MKRPAVLIAVIALNLALIVWLWSRGDEAEAIPPEVTMTSAKLAQVPDFALIHMTYSELRVKVVADPEKTSRWRTMPEPVRRALVLTWVEGSFPGFAALLVNRQSMPYQFTAEDLAEAYDGIGAAAVAEVVREAGRDAPGRSATEPADRKAFADHDAKFREAKKAGKVGDLLRAHIRAYTDEIVGARL